MYTPHTHRAGAGAYARLGVETQAMSASPHQLISMLFDGAITAVGMARHHMAARNIVAKGQAISKAVGIVDNGLKAGLDAKAGGEAGAALVANLSGLYDYVVRRLLQANLHDDAGALDEVESLLQGLASAWREIGTADR
ncbi:flagellar export chaperone FliS [Variovorax sp. KK3]|uniref:flagellar export chaperone FliS n=1 Tax=Variovorax sp. KK3 TaxID=1855728 RepID=UPI00097C4B12|nr:flagellar export chaperone FliS [Variovorax sp. KK3]